ncbi:condensation domain-containing protein [Streptomyces indonesiensis]
MTSSRKDRASALPEELREALRRRLAGKAGRADAIPRADRARPLPLSFAQERLWFLHTLQPEEAGYNSALALRLTGALDVTALSRALDALVERHEALRTTFDDLDGSPSRWCARPRPYRCRWPTSEPVSHPRPGVRRLARTLIRPGI